jgi:hypothetical protein
VSPLEDWIMMGLFFGGVFMTLTIFEKWSKKKNP